ncbi:MAG: P-loop NTPase, partial [Vulcanimicrobiota bacterium]
QDEAIVVIDSPPGTACPAVASLQNAQLAVLVTEPTPFGLNDLKLAVKMLEIMEINYGVVINRSSEFDYIIEEWCGQKGVSIWGKIPVDMKIARIYSEGKIVVDELSEYREKFLEIAGKVLQEGEK